MAPTYTAETKQDAISQVHEGRAVAAVAAATGVHEQTIRNWLAIAAEGGQLSAARPGPKPFFPESAERFDWVVGRQLVATRCGRSVGGGWYRRFVERFPQLTGRSAQALPLTRNFVVSADLTTLFNTLTKLVIELQLDSSRVFNMDETAFQKQHRSKKVIAVRGSSNVWTTLPTANFHLSIVACGSAVGYVVPPAFILPGKTVSLQLLKGCAVEGSAVTTSASGFMNTDLFEEWLHFFAASVPSSVKKPLLLILDGCGSHYSPKVVDAAEHLETLLVFLPSNATHLLQPLDVAVFASLKDKILKLVGDLVEEDEEGCYSINKDTAIAVASLAWRGSNVARNLQRSFNACGLFPLSLVKMNSRLNTFARNGVPRHMQPATWLQMKSIVEDEILKLPPPPRKNTSKKRKRVTVSGRLLTREVLQEIEDGSTSPSASSCKKANPVPRAVPLAMTTVESVVV